MNKFNRKAGPGLRVVFLMAKKIGWVGLERALGADLGTIAEFLAKFQD